MVWQALDWGVAPHHRLLSLEPLTTKRLVNGEMDGTRNDGEHDAQTFASTKRLNYVAIVQTSFIKVVMQGLPMKNQWIDTARLAMLGTLTQMPLASVLAKTMTRWRRSRITRRCWGTSPTQGRMDGFPVQCGARKPARYRRRQSGSAINPGEVSRFQACLAAYGPTEHGRPPSKNRA